MRKKLLAFLLLCSPIFTLSEANVKDEATRSYSKFRKNMFLTDDSCPSNAKDVKTRHSHIKQETIVTSSTKINSETSTANQNTVSANKSKIDLSENSNDVKESDMNLSNIQLSVVNNNSSSVNETKIENNDNKDYIFEDIKKTILENNRKSTFNFSAFKRIKLPLFDNVVLNKDIEEELPGEIRANIKVLNINPLIIQVDNFFDPEECELLIDIAKSKNLKKIVNKIPHIELKNAEQTFKEWDYNQDGFITKDEVNILPGLADIRLSLDDVDDMFFMLKMDQNNDGKVDVEEMKRTNFKRARDYLNSIKSDVTRQRDISTMATWLWHDEDGILKYNKDGYFEYFHDRVSMVTGIPIEILRESEPLQVKKFQEGQFQMVRQDSEAQNKDIPCCLYGDQHKTCRLCRYISYSIFLNDVEEGGELVFPLARHKYQDLENNSGIWRGYYVYAKTTGNRFFFQVDMSFKKDGANVVFFGDGKDESGGFLFENSIVIGETIKFEKRYKDNVGGEPVVKCHGKVIEGTKISGNWWIAGQKRMRGRFFMWNHDYEIFSGRAMDETNRKEKCSQTKSLKIKPKAGRAVFWYNHHNNPRDGMVGDINHEAMSAHCELTKGEKWTVNSWINIIGDGDLELRAWRRGDNWMTYKSKETFNILQMLGTNDEKLSHEPYENEYIAEQLGRNGTSTDETITEGYHKYKPPSNALQALNLLLNDLTREQLRVMARHVHKKLGMQCIPLTVEHEGKVSVIDGSVA